MTWRRLDPQFARRIQLAAFIVGFIFGLDYLFTPVGSSTALSFLERSFFPLWSWGVVIISASLAGFFVEWRILGNTHPMLPTEKRRRWGWVSNMAHILLFAVFVVLTLSTLIDVIGRGFADPIPGEEIGAGHFYGWRTAVMWGGYAYINWEFIRRLGQPI